MSGFSLGVPRRRPAKIAAVALVAYLLIEGTAWVGLRVARSLGVFHPPISTVSLPPEEQATVEAFIAEKDTYVIHSPSLGWTLRPGGVSVDGYRANEQGLRGDRVYDRTPPDGKVRIAAFGDSWVHCDEVANEETWEAVLEDLEPALEVLNFGVGGYGTDQALLRYRESGTGFHPDIVLIGFLSENIGRVVNVFRTFYVPGSPFAKPRFHLEGEQLVLEPNPLLTREQYRALLDEPARILPVLGANDYWYQSMPHAGPFDFLPSVLAAKTGLYGFRRWVGPSSLIRLDGTYRPGTAPLALAERLLVTFRNEVLAAGSLPLTVFFPTHRDIARFQSTGRKRYQPLIDFLASQGALYVDVLEAFGRDAGAPPLGAVTAHFTAEENAWVARYLLEVLRTRGITTRAGVAAIRAKEQTGLPLAR